MCIICMDESSESKIIEYDHCGKYIVHEKCNDKWFMKNKTCFICRENLIDSPRDNNLVIDNEDFLTIDMLTHNVNSNNKCPILCWFITSVIASVPIILLLLL